MQGPACRARPGARLRQRLRGPLTRRGLHCSPAAAPSTSAAEPPATAAFPCPHCSQTRPAFQGWASIAFLGNLGLCLTTLTGISSDLNLPSFTLKSLPFVLAHGSCQKSLSGFPVGLILIVEVAMKSPQLRKVFLGLTSAPVVAERYYILYPLKWEGMKPISLVASRRLFFYLFSRREGWKKPP